MYLLYLDWLIDWFMYFVNIYSHYKNSIRPHIEKFCNRKAFIVNNIKFSKFSLNESSITFSLDNNVFVSLLSPAGSFFY